MLPAPAYRTVAPVEEWLEADRFVWSPNTVHRYATAPGPPLAGLQENAGR